MINTFFFITNKTIVFGKTNKLSKFAIKVKDQKTLIQIATISANGDEVIGKVIAEAIKDMANNENSNAATVMGMNLGNTVAGIIDKNLLPKDKE